MKLQPAKGGKSVSKKKVTVPVRYKDSAKRDAHHLAYITDAEREMLESMRGSLAWAKTTGPGGVPYLPPGATDGYGGRGAADVDAGGGRSNVSGGGGSSSGGGGRAGGVGGANVGGGFSSNDRSGGGGGGRAGGVGRSDVGGGFSSNDRSGGNSGGGGGGGRAGGVGLSGVGGGFSGGNSGLGGGGGNSGIGLGVGGLGGGLGGGYSGPKGGVVGPSDIGRAMSALSGTNAGRMGLAQASALTRGMPAGAIGDIAFGGQGFFGQPSSTNVDDKRDQGPLPGIAAPAFGGLAPAGLGGLFAAGAAPSVAQQVSNAAAKGNLGQMVNSAAKGDFAPTPTAGAPAISGGAANAGALGGMQNAANVGLSSNVAAKSNMGVPSINSRSNMAGLIASQGFGAPRETRSTPIGLSNLSQGQIDNTIAAITGLPGASFTGLSPTGAFATNSPQAANIARSDAMQGLPSAQGYSQPTMTATAPSMSDVAAQVQSPTMSASMSPRNRASLAPAMQAMAARNAAPASTDLSGVPGAYSNTTDTSGYTDVTDEARNIAQGNYMDAFKGGLEKLGLGNMLSIGGMLSGMGNPNLRNDGTNRGGNDRYVRGLLEAMNPQTPAPEAPGTVRPGNWVPPGLLMRPNPFPAVWQNRNPWQGYV